MRGESGTVSAQSSLAAACSVDGSFATPTYSMRYLRDLPQTCQATGPHSPFMQPFCFSGNTGPYTAKEERGIPYRPEKNYGTSAYNFQEYYFYTSQNHYQLLCYPNVNYRTHKSSPFCFFYFVFPGLLNKAFQMPK